MSRCDTPTRDDPRHDHAHLRLRDYSALRKVRKCYITSYQSLFFDKRITNGYHTAHKYSNTFLQVLLTRLSGKIELTFNAGHPTECPISFMKSFIIRKYLAAAASESTVHIISESVIAIPRVHTEGYKVLLTSRICSNPDYSGSN